jgi:S1-C subfamily serine protease
MLAAHVANTVTRCTVEHQRCNRQEDVLQGVAQHVLAVARVTPHGGVILGTAFGLTSNLAATASHVVGDDPRNLVLIAPNCESLRDYQDTTIPHFQTMNVSIAKLDPIRDICLLSTEENTISFARSISNTDNLNPGDRLALFGYPHADGGRVVLTQQDTQLGAKVLLENKGIKSKHIVLNIQTRPGQSGSPVYTALGDLVAVVIGSYVPTRAGTLMVGGVDPATLHQTTHAISAEYLKGLAGV